MRPQILLILGCFGLGTIITYCWWATVRADMLRLRLAEIRDELDAAVAAKQHSSHGNYIRLRGMIDWLIRFAHCMSIPALMLHSRMNSGNNFELQKARGVEEFLNRLDREGPNEVRDAKSKILIAMAIHVLLTPSFFASIIYLLSRGKLHAMASKLANLRYPLPADDPMGAAIK